MAKRFPTKLLCVGFILAGLGAIAWQGWNWWNWASAPPVAGADEKPVNLNIRPGTSAQEIGQDLETLGLIRSAQAWNFWSRWLMFRDKTGGFQAGTYQISKTQPMQKIATQIWTGDVAQTTFTVPEGWSIREMAQYFESQKYFSAQDFLNAVDQFSTAAYPWLPTNPPPAGFPKLEGFLFPDTYQIPVGVSIQPEYVIKLMLDRFEQVALPVYQQHQSKTKLSLAEWVTLGSLVEKESVVPQERSRISGVFHNRLQKQMPLASDPTVEYAFGITQTPDRPLTYRQVETPHPFNTYVNVGLPPAPIASPGKASLEATLTPEATDYLYFVARYDGTHVFSRTLAEHQAAQNAIHDQREANQSTGQSGNTQKN